MHIPLFAHLCLFRSLWGRVQAEQRCPGAGTVPAAALVPQGLWPRHTGPWVCRWSTAVHVTGTAQNRPGKSANDWTQQLTGKKGVGLQTGQHPLSTACSLHRDCTWPSRGKSPGEEVPEQQWQPQRLCLCLRCAGSWAAHGAVLALQPREPGAASSSLPLQLLQLLQPLHGHSRQHKLQ